MSLNGFFISYVVVIVVSWLYVGLFIGGDSLIAMLIGYTFSGLFNFLAICLYFIAFHVMKYLERNHKL